MRRQPTELEVRQIRALQGEMSAQACGVLYDLGAETIRRIWRRETHRHVTDAPETDSGASESLDRLSELLRAEPTEGNQDGHPA